MRLVLCMLVLWPASLAAASPLVSGQIAVASGHHFQGIDQNGDRTSLYGSLALHASDSLTAGIWVGQFKLPRYGDTSTELDYFVSYTRQLSFGSRIETSLWRYTYLDSTLSSYNWTQWLISYDPDERFTITLGLSHDQFRYHEWSKFIELTARHDFGVFVGALSVARNEVTGSPIGSFDYVELKAARGVGAVDIFGSYSKPVHVESGFASRLVHHGFEVGVSYSF